MYEYLCTLDEKRYECGAVDGDTIDVIIDLGFKIHSHVRIRLLWVDTPERGEKDYKRATEELRNLLREATATDHGGLSRLYVRTTKQGSFGRWLGEFTSLDRDININRVLEEEWPYDKWGLPAKNKLDSVKEDL